MKNIASGDSKTYIFLDESGKPEVFSAKNVNLVSAKQASKFLVIASIRTEDQLKLQQDIAEFRLTLLKDTSINSLFSPAYSLEAFHANVDYKEVRKRFYCFISTLSDIKIDVIVVEKLKCYSTLQHDPGRLYGVMAGQLLKDQLHRNETEVIFSRKDSKLKLRKELEIEVERQRIDFISKHKHLDNRVKLSYFHNPHYTHGGLQVADYIAFAIFHVFENGNKEYYEILKNRIGRIHDICNKKYFTRSNLL